MIKRKREREQWNENDPLSLYTEGRARRGEGTKI
jgi:hypothetical protein